MRYTSIAVSALTALTLFSPAVTGAAIRRNAAPSGGYTLTYTTDQGQEVAHADDKGSIDVKVKGLLISVAIDDKDDIAQCIVKDKNGYQIRKLGGKDIEQTFIEFEDEDGKQAKSIVCAIGEEKPDGGKGWEDVKEPPKEEPKNDEWSAHPVPKPEPPKPQPPKEEWSAHPVPAPEPPKPEPPKNEWTPHPVPQPEPPKQDWTDKPEPPKPEPPKPEPPKQEPPKQDWTDKPEPPKPEPPKPEPPKQDWTDKPEPPKPEPPKPEPPKPEPPKQDWTDKPEPPKPEPPKPEPPKQEPPKQDWTDKPEPPKQEPPKQEPPKEQGGWGDNAHGGGKPQDGGHGGDHGKPQEGGDKPY